LLNDPRTKSSTKENLMKSTLFVARPAVCGAVCLTLATLSGCGAEVAGTAATAAAMQAAQASQAQAQQAKIVEGLKQAQDAAAARAASAAE
jgi:hypothetical protein